MQSRIVDIPEGRIEYTLVGNGPVILNCHGTSSNCYSTAGVAPLVEAGFSILTPSRPGYGRTPLKVGESTTAAASALIALLDCLEIESCMVMATSGGGPTGIALTANFPHRVTRLVLVEAISQPEIRAEESSYKNQITFYGPMHNVIWTMLQLISRLSPRSMARQTMMTFSTHDPDDVMKQLTQEDINTICRFYQGSSSRIGALNDLTHTVGKILLQKILVPTLVIHSREDKSVPFSHAEWSMANIPQVELCESGITGHFFWVGPDYSRVTRKLIAFLKDERSMIDQIELI